jgi:hypothetical protein
MGIGEVVSSPSSPWQNPYVERVIGSIRRECLDHVIVLSEQHLRRLLTAYLTYYHGREHISPCRRTRPRRDACRRRSKGPWSRSRNLADSIIATSAAPPDRARSTLDSTLTSDYVSAWRPRVRSPRLKAIVFVTAPTAEASTLCRNRD